MLYFPRGVCRSYKNHILIFWIYSKGGNQMAI